MRTLTILLLALITIFLFLLTATQPGDLSSLYAICTSGEFIYTLLQVVSCAVYYYTPKQPSPRYQRNTADGVAIVLYLGVLSASYLITQHCEKADARANLEAKKLDVTGGGKGDVASTLDTYFQTPSTEIMSKIVDLHDDLMFFLVVIVLVVSGMLLRKVLFFNTNNTTTPRVAFAHHTLLEKIGTYIPAGILVLIASPSFSLLYAIDALAEPQITIKIIGHQGYGSYEITDYNTTKDVNFDSYMMLTTDLPRGGLRLLEVDNRLALPVRTNLRLIITAADVIHSGAVPALGVKMDACPGRLNQVSLHINRAGAFFGQCSELCGINHSFMPIVVDATFPEMYRLGLLQSRA